MEQWLESAEGEETKRYIHHYEMPPYSVGETGRVGFASRREVGHGALAERALSAVIPSTSEFPYTIRVVSEIMSSNGSTSMASTCGSTLSLMDAGVPIKEPVAGISIGLMTKGDKYLLLTDIMGVEDFNGDMDFKVAGTKNGITAIQLDMKIAGISFEMIEETLKRARDTRLFILDKMLKVIPTPRPSISKYAPKIETVQVPVERIGEVIGPGGKVIKSIITSTGADVNVDDDGTVTVAGSDQEGVEKAINWVKSIVREIKPGEEFTGEVRRILPFGAFVEILPGKEGMVHLSQMSMEFVKSAEDMVKVGQEVQVRVMEIDDQGRINLSMLTEEQSNQKRTASRSSGPREGGENFPPRSGGGRYSRDSRGGRGQDRGQDRRRERYTHPHLKDNS
jgi:polyribonucleotide nucleotidyltransferase